MDDNNGYAVFFYPKAVEALGDGIKPYLQDGKGGAHIVCRTVDTGGALIGMTLQARTTGGDTVQVELMVPTSMVMMIVSARSDEGFGFGPRIAVEAVATAAGDGSAAQIESEVAKPRAPKKKKGSASRAAKPVPARARPAKPKATEKTKPSKPSKPGKPAKTGAARKRSQA